MAPQLHPAVDSTRWLFHQSAIIGQKDQGRFESWSYAQISGVYANLNSNISHLSHIIWAMAMTTMNQVSPMFDARELSGA